MTTKPVPSPKTHRRSSYRRLIALLVVSAALAVAGFYFRRTPTRDEPPVREASLPELQARADREPQNARAFFDLGLSLRAAGRLKDSANALARAAELQPDDEETWLEWARTVYRGAGATDAYRIVDRFLQNHPNSARAHSAMASLYARSEYWASALEEATKAVALDAKDLEAWQTMGKAGLRVQDYGRAETGFKHSVELAPGDWHGYLGLSEVYSTQGRTVEALDECRKAVELSPTEPETHLQFGKLLLRAAHSKADVEAARRRLMMPLTSTVPMTPERAFFVAFYVGQSYQRDADWRQARTWLERAAALSPNDPTVQRELVTVYQRLGDKMRFAVAVKRLREINTYLSETKALSDRIAGAPTDLETRLKLARLRAAHGDVEEAIKDYGLLLLRAPNLAAARREYDVLRQRYTRGAR